MTGYSNRIFDRYLALLGIDGSAPDLERLCALTSAQLIRAPFENISKIVRVRVQGARWIPELERYLDDIESANFGGTCNTNNLFFNQLLRHLDYDAATCGAQIAAPGTTRNGHMVNLVKLDGEEWMIDVGYGAPFWQPIPRERTDDVKLRLGEDEYLFKPRDSERRTKVEVYHKGNLVHGYLMRSDPMTLEDFRGSIEHSYQENATFLNRLRICKFFDNRAITLNNNSLVEMDGTSATARRIESPDELIATIVQKFEMPLDDVRIAVHSLSDETLFGR
jgi:N-hydroxyarylamine O-acetyltransferase